MKFIHTSDWQIGISLGQLGDRAEEARRQRVCTLERISELAREREVDFVVVAGDVFDGNGIAAAEIARVIEILRGFRRPVYLLPGNHDFLGPASVYANPLWAQVERDGLMVIREPRAHAVPGGVLIGVPSTGRFEQHDPTEPMATIVSPPEAIRVGVAHGALQRGDIVPDGPRPIALDAPSRARLDYLALGDWHSYFEHRDPAGRLAVYSGTHEQTKFGEAGAGDVCVVEIDAPGARPRVERVRVGFFTWLERRWELGIASAEQVRQEIEAITEPERTIMRGSVAGLCDPQDLQSIETLALQSAERLFHFVLDTGALQLLPASREQWLERVPEGTLRAVADHLFARAEAAEEDHDREVALRALALLAGVAS